MTTPFQFTLSGNDSADWGQFRWCAGLNDGREISFSADRVELKDGHLIAWGHSKRDETKEQLLFILAPSMWTDVYAASVLDGSPIGMDYITAREQS